MVLTKKQEEGLKVALERWRMGEKYTCIGGYAGSGKSTLIKFIISAMNLEPEEVRYVAYTGKAASVLRSKGNQGAITAHKLLYHARLMPDGRYFFVPKMRSEMEPEVKVVVVDEVSMIPIKMWNLLCSFNFYILACGDPEQLPPPPDEHGEDTNNHVLDNPHVFLDEIMRQAQESEIIRLSMHIREGKPLATFPVANEQVMIFNKNELIPSMFNWADQVLCSTNNTRNKLNLQIRASRNYPVEPQIGDKIINLHNEWDIYSENAIPLVNGTTGTITQMELMNWNYPFWIRHEKLDVPIISLTIQSDDDDIYSMIAFDYQELMTGTPTLTRQEEGKIKKSKKLATPCHGVYGYAITVWKAQGSEWGKVLLMEEPYWPREALMKKQYLYTGITRAVDKLVVIRK